MPYQISVDSDHDLVRVSADGVITFADALQCRKESVSCCRDQDINRLLADMRHGEWQLSMEDALNFGMTMLEEGFPNDIRFACMCRPGDTLPVIMVRALALSGATVRMVKTEQEAFAYLAQPYPVI